MQLPEAAIIHLGALVDAKTKTSEKMTAGVRVCRRRMTDRRTSVNDEFALSSSGGLFSVGLRCLICVRVTVGCLGVL